jgi:UDP-N-acetylmuramate--alanine ligase
MVEHIHFIGIGGVGMSALAILAKQKGYKVTGSDENVYFTDSMLKKNGIEWYKEFSEKNLKIKPDYVVISAAYDEKNPEVAEAKSKHIPIKFYSQMLGEIMSSYRGIAIAGCHGKTTTTAMAAFLLEKARLSPSFLIGCREAPDLHSNARIGEGEFFVTEADEYKRAANDLQSKFFDIKMEFAVITSIEMDHPDVFETEEDVYRAFYKFACRIPRNGLIVGCIDSPKVKKLALSLADRKMETYGFSISADWRIVDYQLEAGKQIFTIKKAKQIYGPFELKIPGKHNVLNATAAIIVCLAAGVKAITLQKYLPEFSGVERRFQIVGERDGITVVDDYAHHPTAIKATLEGAKDFYPGRKIWAIFQPHTYSRTKELLEEFAKSFSSADEVVITDIYASAREKSGRIHAKHLVEEAKKNHEKVRYISDLKEIEAFLRENTESGDVLIVMGAGDIYKMGLSFLEKD